MGLRKYIRRFIQQSSGNSALQGSVDQLTQSLATARREARIDSIRNRWSMVDTLETKLGTFPPAALTCPLCAHSAQRTAFQEYLSHCIFAGGRLLRHGCPNCQVIFGPGKMFELNDRELGEDYQQHYSVFEEGDSSAQERRAFLSLKPTQQGTYLNYGAGRWSDTTQKLRSEGWNVYSYDPYAEAAHQGHALTTADLEHKRFDGIFSNNVLEHLRHPAADLRRQASLLKPQGSLALATPCFAYLYEFTRFHLFFYTGRSRTVLLEQAGLVETDFIEDGEFMNLVCRPIAGS
jgi:hypothetical protein